MEWIKNNIVSIISVALGSAGLIGSIASQVQNMAAAYPNVFWWWTASMLAFGVFIGVAISKLGKRKSEDRLAAIREAEETKRREIAKEEATKRAQIEADRDLELERMREERARQEKTEAAEAALAKLAYERDLVANKMIHLPYLQSDMLLSAIQNNGVCEHQKTNALAGKYAS